MYILLENDTEGVTLNEVKGLITLAGSLLVLRMTLLIAFCLFVSSSPAAAFNEFQTYIEQNSKKQLNCAYCHSNVNGPPSLSEEEKQLTAYNQFLKANKEFINSPILNEFGNYLIKKLGYETIVQAQEDPKIIVDKLRDSDLDKDGITDSEEFLDGTLPNDPLDGAPFKLFINNLKKKWLEICFQILAVVLLIISLFKLKA